MSKLYKNFNVNYPIISKFAFIFNCHSYIYIFKTKIYIYSLVFPVSNFINLCIWCLCCSCNSYAYNKLVLVTDTIVCRHYSDFVLRMLLLVDSGQDFFGGQSSKVMKKKSAFNLFVNCFNFYPTLINSIAHGCLY